VVVITDAKTVVLSPDDVEGFIAAVRPAIVQSGSPKTA
jgi:hypothetical protein